ncbi:MAG: HD domain-containing protein [Blastocatellales bacterium]|nr:HD domain-containing protein [Blastocatellales bacterium]
MISAAVINLCRAVREAGGRALLVGGWVRDHLRGTPEMIDYDIEVYGLEAERLRALLARLGRVDAVGEAFTVYKLRLSTPDEASPFIVVDVSLPRRESKTGRGHRGFDVVGDPSMSVEEAARRRDFTINAILYDPLGDEYIDPHGGLRDLEAGVLRAVDRRTFVEDSLRVLRAMQFAARFEYGIAPDTVDLCRGIALDDLPAERIWGEVEKWLSARRPSIGLHAARSLGVLDKLWPEIAALIGCPQDPCVHPEGDVFTHTGMVLDQARRLVDDLPRPKAIAVMLAALCHDFGKPSTTRMDGERLRAPGHAEAGVKLTEDFLARLKLFTLEGYDVRGQVLQLVAQHLKPVYFHRAHKRGETVTDGDFRRLALWVEPGLLYRVALADCLGRTGDFQPEAEQWFIERVRDLGIELRAPEPLLLGRHLLKLGLQPGPRVGEICRAVYELQLDGEVATLDEAVAAAKRVKEREITEQTE